MSPNPLMAIPVILGLIIWVITVDMKFVSLEKRIKELEAKIGN